MRRRERRARPPLPPRAAQHLCQMLLLLVVMSTTTTTSQERLHVVSTCTRPNSGQDMSTHKTGQENSNAQSGNTVNRLSTWGHDKKTSSGSQAITQGWDWPSTSQRNPAPELAELESEDYAPATGPGWNTQTQAQVQGRHSCRRDRDDGEDRVWARLTKGLGELRIATSSSPDEDWGDLC